MTDADLNVLILELQRSTQLGRLSHSEAVAVFSRLKELGHDVTDSGGLAPGVPEGVHPNYAAPDNA